MRTSRKVKQMRKRLLCAHFSKNPVNLESLWGMYYSSKCPGPWEAANVLAIVIVDLKGPVSKTKKHIPGSNNSRKNAGRVIDSGRRV
tara:strand:+ start:577 stop:837 length:261 start_codon:yes stop_codon:yes gene_type:complete